MKRSINQDYVVSFIPSDPLDLERSGRLFILADGVGGASEGDKASQFAAQKVLSEYYRYPELPPADRLGRLLQQAGNELYDHAEQSGNFKRMATTMVAVVVRNETLTVANVGDSRAYLIRNGQITQITKDHNLVGEMMRRGEISEQEAQHSRVKNRLTRSIGGERNVRVDVFDNIPLQAGDRIFMCSDGLTRYSTNEQMLEIAREGSPEEVVDRAIEFANQQGGADNVSATLVEIGGGAGALGPEDALETKTVPSMKPYERARRPQGLGGILASGPLGYFLLAVAAIGVVAVIFFGVKLLLPQADKPDLTATAEEGLAIANHLTETQAALAMLTVVPSDTVQPTGTESSTETPTASQTLQAVSNQVYLVCDNTLKSRIHTGVQATVSTSVGEGLTVYEEAGSESAVVETLNPGTFMQVVSGPNCVGDAVWWEVRLPGEDGKPGWVQEGNGDVFWLIPESLACVYEAGKEGLDSLSTILEHFSLKFINGNDYYRYPPEACGSPDGQFSCDEAQKVKIEPPYDLDLGWWILVFGVPENQCEISGGQWSTRPTG